MESSTEQWIKLVGEYGLSIAFLICVLGILLYTAIILIGICREWIPKWVESSIKSHERIAKAVENQCDMLSNIHSTTDATREAAIHSVKAAKQYKEHPSSVMLHLDNAERSLSKN